METNFEQGTLLWYWFEEWLVVVGFVVALLLAVLVVAKSGWAKGDRQINAIMLVAVLAALPLTLMRLGIDIGMLSDSTAGFTSLAGVVGSLVVGLPYLVGVGSLTDEEWEERTLDRFRLAETVCDHFSLTMAKHVATAWTKVSAAERDLVVKEELSAAYQVIEKLSSTLQAVKTYPEPRSAEARRARRSFESALSRYISPAKLAERQLMDSQKLAEHVAYGVISERNATERMAKPRTRIFSKISLAQEDLARAKAYFRGKRVVTTTGAGVS